MSAPVLIYREKYDKAAPQNREARLCQLAADYGREIGVAFPPLQLACRQQDEKPRFAAAQPHFSLSHSGDLVLYAFSMEEIGLDTERLRSMPRAKMISRRFFHPQEQTWLLGRRQIVFFSLWTAKEAVVKWRGTGIDWDFAKFSVVPALTEGSPLHLPEGELYLTQLFPQNGYVACLATPQITEILFKNVEDL